MKSSRFPIDRFNFATTTCLQRSNDPLPGYGRRSNGWASHLM
jgi:hypothetical protein